MYSYEDLEKAPVGTKITFENDEEILVKTSEYTIENEIRTEYLSDYKYLKSDFDGLGKIIKIEEPNYTTVHEVKDILDDKEKQYLSAVIKPFRENVRCIVKYNYYDGRNSFLAIRFKEDVELDFPDFKYGTMYKGMKANKEYTPKELGL